MIAKVSMALKDQYQKNIRAKTKRRVTDYLQRKLRRRKLTENLVTAASIKFPDLWAMFKNANVTYKMCGIFLRGTGPQTNSARMFLAGYFEAFTQVEACQSWHVLKHVDVP